MKIKLDENLNPVLRQEAQSLREMINKGVDSERFKKTPCNDQPAYMITDTETNRQTIVPLCSLADVMQVLNELFE